MNESHKRYSLFTAIAMIVGICIGSGIFFKADNVLAATHGSIFLGALLFILGAIAIIFGGWIYLLYMAVSATVLLCGAFYNSRRSRL